MLEVSCWTDIVTAAKNTAKLGSKWKQWILEVLSFNLLSALGTKDIDDITNGVKAGLTIYLHLL